MRARLLLYAFALLGIVACSQRTAGAIEFDAAGTPTVVATRTTPAATPTLPLATPTAPVATPTLPVTTPTAPVATATAPIATATRAAPTATAVPTRPVATPTRLVPTADPTEPPATPFAAPTPQVELAQQPVFAFPTAELPLGMPGPNTLVYQAFWSGAAHNQLQQSDWRGDPGWSTALGILENGGIQQPGIEFASPFLMGNARALVQSGNYAVQAQIASDNTPGSAFGVYIRRGSPAVNASSQPLTAGLWRGGVVDRTHAFILAEQFLT